VHLLAMADGIGLDSLWLLPLSEDWLLDGSFSRAIIRARLPYTPPDEIDGRLDHLISLELITEQRGLMEATPRLRPLLDAMLDARARVAADLWTGHEREAATIVQLGRLIADRATPEHVAGVAHRALADPVHPFLRLDHRLFTLRYLRQADHVAAWTAAGLSAEQVVALTALWNGETSGLDRPALEQLVERGYATAAPTATDLGRQVRDQIELETNRRAAATFGALDHAQADAMLSALHRIPDSV